MNNMKNRYIKLLLLSLGVSVFFSCNDDFMQRDPINDMGTDYLTKMKDLNVFIEGVYNEGVVGHRKGGLNFGAFGLHNQKSGSPLTYGDIFSDNLAFGGGVDSRFNGTYDTPQNNDGTDWKWTYLNRVNYFLNNCYRVTDGTKEDVHPLAAEARFFRAWEYYKKVLAYGEVPWSSKSLNIDSEELYGARMPRKQLSDSIIADLDFAIEWAIDNGNPNGRVNKDMARFLKARYCLFEATFRKYHKVSISNEKLDDAAEINALLRMAIKAADEIGVMGGSARYELYNAVPDAYYQLFTFLGTPATDGHKEAILARVYDGDLVGHDNQQFYQMNNHTRYSMGATVDFIEEYLCSDGKPIYLGGSKGNYQKNPLFKGYDGLWEELDNRDPRLRMTVNKPGEYASIYDIPTGVFGLDKAGILYPTIRKDTEAYPFKQLGTTITGYRVIKHVIHSKKQWDLGANGSQTALMFRYAELLLIYAEAKELLGEFNQAVADATINKLRERAGFAPSAYLKVGSITPDPRLNEIYAMALDYTISPAMIEIRRERRVEMAIENQRYEDLIRWKAGKLFTLPRRGMKMTAEKQALYARKEATVKDPVTGIQTHIANSILNSEYYLDNDGFIMPWYNNPNIKDGVWPWDDKRYYYPIPLRELLLNKNLVQAPGWRK